MDTSIEAKKVEVGCLRVMIHGQNESFCFRLRQKLAEYGVTVYCFDSLLDLRRGMRTFGPDLVVLDYASLDAEPEFFIHRFGGRLGHPIHRFIVLLDNADPRTTRRCLDLGATNAVLSARMTRLESNSNHSAIAST